MNKYRGGDEFTPDPMATLKQSSLVAAKKRLAISPELFALNELDVMYDEEEATLWTFMNPSGRPSFTPQLLGDFRTWQAAIGSSFGPDKADLRYLVLGSRVPGVFCYGGDLELFVSLIRNGNRQALLDYGWACVRILHRNINALDLPIITIGLAEGDALGGGLEALLSFDIIIAERGASFGLPEAAFGLFPGMGAHSLLVRRIGRVHAEEMIMSGDTYSAEKLHEWGLINVLADPGKGKEVTQEFIRKNSRRHVGQSGALRAMRIVNPIPLIELEKIVEIWAESALRLREQDLRLMLRLAGAQSRRVDGERNTASAA